MSSSKGIAQWLRELATSDRSANDPWTISSRHFASGESSPAISADLGQPFSGLDAEIQNQQQSVRANTQGAESSNGNSGSTGSSGGSGFQHILGNIFPVFGGIASLFGGGGSEPKPELTPYVFAPSIAFSGALPESGNTTASLSHGEDGLPRSSTSSPAVADQLLSLVNKSDSFEPTAGLGIAQQQLTTLNPSVTSFSPVSESSAASEMSASSSSSSSQQQIVVQVQAMDSQSFLDRSQDIAQAVRQAMLNSHPVNDVIMDL